DDAVYFARMKAGAREAGRGDLDPKFGRVTQIGPVRLTNACRGNEPTGGHAEISLLDQGIVEYRWITLRFWLRREVLGGEFLQLAVLQSMAWDRRGSAGDVRHYTNPAFVVAPTCSSGVSSLKPQKIN